MDEGKQENTIPERSEAEIMALKEEWYKEAKDMTVEKLPVFVAKLAAANHDYSSIVYAMGAAAVAAVWALEHSPQGGITGFQASCVMWEFIKEWMGKESPQRLLDFGEMLYPQYEYKFRSITPSSWEFVQETARQYLEGAKADSIPVHPEVVKHWKNIVKGQVPFGYRIVKE